MNPAGFSGYICELLIAKFNNFNSLLQNPQQVIDFLMYELADPTSKNRNLTKSFTNFTIIKLLNLLSRHNGIINTVSFSKVLLEEAVIMQFPFTYDLRR